MKGLKKFFICIAVLIGVTTSVQAQEEESICEADLLYTIEMCPGLPDVDTFCYQSINSDCKMIDDKKCEPCVEHKNYLTVDENQDLEESLEENNEE